MTIQKVHEHSWMAGKDEPTRKIHKALGIKEDSDYYNKAVAYDCLISGLRNYFNLDELEDFADWLSPDDEDADEEINEDPIY